MILVLECLCIYFLFVETKGPTLEEIARLFDGDQAHLASEETIEQRVREKSVTMENTQQVEKAHE